MAEINLKIHDLETGGSPKKKKWKCQDTDRQVKRLIGRYAEFKEHGEELNYLHSLGYATVGNLKCTYKYKINALVRNI